MYLVFLMVKRVARSTEMKLYTWIERAENLCVVQILYTSREYGCDYGGLTTSVHPRREVGNDMFERESLNMPLSAKNGPIEPEGATRCWAASCSTSFLMLFLLKQSGVERPEKQASRLKRHIKLH
jgi:hypothetical protein